MVPGKKLQPKTAAHETAVAVTISTRQINEAKRTEMLTKEPGTLHAFRVSTDVRLGKDYYSIGDIENYDYDDELTELNYVTCIL